MSERIDCVIVAVDDSAEARAATRHAALLAYLLDAELHLTHVVPLKPAELSDLPSNRDLDDDFARDQLNARIEATFARALEGLDPLSFKDQLTITESRLRDDSFVRHPERALADLARQRPRSLLVMGARHMSDAGKWFKGSVSNAVIHRARGPVTVLHADAAIVETARIGRILLATDGTSQSDVAARLAGDLARSGHIGVDMLFCQPPVAIPPLENGDSEASRVFRQTREALGEVPAGIEERVVEATRYAEALANEAAAHADSPVIIMGRRRLGHFQASLLGSVSQRVIELSPCPVTVVV